jgi:hypothetical protein
VTWELKVLMMVLCGAPFMALAAWTRCSTLLLTILQQVGCLHPICTC